MIFLCAFGVRQQWCYRSYREKLRRFSPKSEIWPLRPAIVPYPFHRPNAPETIEYNLQP